MNRQITCNVQHGKVLQPQEVDLEDLQPQEVDLGGHGHGHEVHGSVEVGRAAHQNS